MDINISYLINWKVILKHWLWIKGYYLKIKFKTGTLYEIRQVVVYEVYPFPSDIYDTKTLEQNGEEIIFKGIYVNWFLIIQI